MDNQALISSIQPGIDDAYDPLYVDPEVLKQIEAATVKPASELVLDVALELDIAEGRIAIDRILRATQDELRSKAFVLSCLRQFGTCPIHWPSDADYEPSLNASKFGMIQYPSEFVDFLLIAGQSRPTTIAEVGVAHGCSSYFAAAYFFALNPESTYTMIDIADTLIDFDYYETILPLAKAIPSVSTAFAGQSFDLVFIDADHSYRGVRQDYQSIGRHAKICAFHDIKATRFETEEGGITQFWDELKERVRDTHLVYEIAHSRKANWMGIGVVIDEQ